MEQVVQCVSFATSNGGRWCKRIGLDLNVACDGWAQTILGLETMAQRVQFHPAEMARTAPESQLHPVEEHPCCCLKEKGEEGKGKNEGG